MWIQHVQFFLSGRLGGLSTLFHLLTVLKKIMICRAIQHHTSQFLGWFEAGESSF